MLSFLTPYSLNGCKHGTCGISYPDRQTQTHWDSEWLCYCVTYVTWFLHLSANLGCPHVNNNGSRRCTGGWKVKTNQWCIEREKNTCADCFCWKDHKRLLILYGVWVLECVISLWAWNAVRVRVGAGVCLSVSARFICECYQWWGPSARACLNVRVCLCVLGL